MPTLNGNVFSGFTRPSDPINALDLALQISAVLNKVVIADVSSSDVSVTGASLVSGDASAIQSAISSYYYNYSQVGIPLIDSPNMSAAAHDKGITQYAAYMSDAAAFSAANSKTAVRYWENGVFKNGTPATGDIIVFTDTTTTASGSATFYPTSDHTVIGTALCSYLSSNSFQPNYRDSTGVYAPGAVTVGTGNKSISQAFAKQSFAGVTVVGINVLGSASNVAIPNGVTVMAQWWGVSA